VIIRELRHAREIIGELACLKQDLVVFLGIYNSAEFFSKLEKWLPRLDTKGAPMLVVDNHSSDETWEWVKERLGQLLEGRPVVYVRNPVNLGATGSLALNMDILAGAKWVMTLHQDDEYLPTHVEEHKKVILTAPVNLGMISSESRSVSPKGKTLSYPRGAWFLASMASPADIFIAHLKNHSYPFSGATFSIKMLQEIPILWHSTAFPDTEMVLKALPKWGFHYIPKSTVRYLENPASESHALNGYQRDLGAFLALVRVFRCQEFSKLLRTLPLEQVRDFSIGLNDGLKIRLKDPTLLGLIQAIAQEAVVEECGPSRTGTEFLAPAFLDLGDHQAAATLSNLANFAPLERAEAAQDPIIFFSQDSSYNSPQGAGILTRLAPALLGLLPPALGRFLYTKYLELPFLNRSRSQWNFKWRR